ncbi:hypothetical protein ACFE04_018419 [Oxalis oulophora]
MASPSHELSLDCKPHSTYSMLLKSFGDQHQQQQEHHQTNKNNNNNNIEDFLSRLEEERVKIDAFKRELPLCMQLLTNAMEASRQQLQAQKVNQQHQGSIRPVLEEFIPLKNSTNEATILDNKTINATDKANWMTNALLWNPTSCNNNNENNPIKENSTDHTINHQIGFNVVSPKLGLDMTKQRNGGAFLPFSKDRNSSVNRALPELALANSNSGDQKLEMEIINKCSVNENSIDQSGNRESGNNNNNGDVVLVIDQQQQSKGGSDGQLTSGNSNNQTHRKARRCWSPDLHRRFVNALQMLGGSQVATPKQIRELMKVDGLTNDEVKSHLQKYRLHTRRPSPSPQQSGSQTPQLVVLGGIWVPPEYATAAQHGGPTLYGTHHHHPTGPPHFCPSPVPQDFYTALPPPPPTHHHAAFHHQLHMFKAASRVQSSPESDLRGAGDRSESIEDGKSESSSWKGESGDNNGGASGGEKKGLAALRDDGEQESNGSEITLKF